jgi:SDR family mycofactocin-dependent oxidoreductase
MENRILFPPLIGSEERFMGRVEGRVAFITGAARGQGRSHAVRLAQEGCDIIAVDVCAPIAGINYAPATPADLAETVRLVEGLDRRIVARRADVRDLPALERAVTEGVEALGRLDIVAANAGIGGGQPTAPHELAPELWTEMLDINLTGVWNTCRAAIPHLIAGGRGGAIVITSSAAALRGYGNIAHYVSAKHGLVGLMRTLAIDLGPHNIRVTNIAPTQVDTEMLLNDEMYRLFRPDLDNPTREDLEVASQAMHLLPTPWVEAVDVSNALLFLASDEGRFITCTTLAVDAGVTQH